MQAQFDHFSINMTRNQAATANHPGQCDSDVLALSQQPAIRRQLAHITDADLITELSEYGAWEPEELQDRHQNEQRIIWIAAGNILEDEPPLRRPGPRFRCYDNADTPHETADHYTIITVKRPYYCAFSSANPNHPQGVWSCEETRQPADSQEQGRFGKRVTFNSLPERVRVTMLQYITPDSETTP